MRARGPKSSSFAPSPSLNCKIELDLGKKLKSAAQMSASRNENESKGTSELIICTFSLFELQDRVGFGYKND